MPIEDIKFNNEFDVVVICQTLHELKIFRKNKVPAVLNKIYSALKPTGRLIILGHFDPGNGFMKIKLPDKIKDLLSDFKKKFKYRAIRGNRLFFLQARPISTIF